MKCKLGDIMIFRNGKKRPGSNGSIPVYGGNGILDYTNEFNQTNSIIVGRVGAYCGSVFYESQRHWVSDNAISAQNKDNSDIVFDYYLLSSLSLNKRHIGTSQPLLTQEILNGLDVDVPDLTTQRAIAATLSCLDDKIANNTKINHHLEQMAQEIFKSWFVDFEPWGGKMPEDWREGSLLDIADYLNSLALQRFRPTDGEAGLPVLKIKELRQGVCDSSSELCSPSIRPEYIVHDGDVVFSWSGSLLVDFWCGDDCGLNQHLFKVTSPKYAKWFYYLWTCHYLEDFVAMAKDKATTMGHIKREALENAKVLIPNEKNYAAIGELIAPLYEQLIGYRIENRKLALLRDTLLPRLMAGEIKIAKESRQ